MTALGGVMAEILFKHLDKLLAGDDQAIAPTGPRSTGRCSPFCRSAAGGAVCHDSLLSLRT